VGIILLFESSIGYSRSQGPNTLLLSVKDNSDEARDQFLSAFELNGQLYFSVNHWPRQWYERVLDKPEGTLTYRGESTNTAVVPIAAGSELR
jgi:hypothetical protein